MLSCQSSADRDRQVLKDALQSGQAAGNMPAGDSMQLPIQQSPYTVPVRPVPKQEELIAACRVKSVRQTYEGGWSLTRYDKKGYKLSEESDYSGKKTYSHKLDDKGRLVQERTTYKDGTVYTTEYSYNEEGKLIRRTFTDSEGKASVTEIEYNAFLNTRTERSATGVDKEFYDNRGLRVRFESYDDKDKLMGYGEALYNEEGLKQSETAFIMGMNTHDEMKYNEKGQLLEQHRTGILDVYFRFEYNEKGLKTREKTVKNGREEETLYEYTYY
jgi:YD repeat-containing protein